MSRSTMTKATGVGLLMIGLALALPADAQTGGVMGGPQGQGMEQMSGLMHDMSGQMTSMYGQMSHGNLSAAQQKQMAERMHSYATMMNQMSGIMGGA